MSIDDIVDAGERKVKHEKARKSVDYDSYRNKTHLNIILTDAELTPLPKGIYGMHVVERGKSYINDILRSDVLQRYRTGIHEQLHKVMQTGSEYVVRTIEAFISGVKPSKSRYDKEPKYIS